MGHRHRSNGYNITLNALLCPKHDIRRNVFQTERSNIFCVEALRVDLMLLYVIRIFLCKMDVKIKFT